MPDPEPPTLTALPGNAQLSPGYIFHDFGTVNANLPYVTVLPLATGGTLNEDGKDDGELRVQLAKNNPSRIVITETRVALTTRMVLVDAQCT